MSRDTTFRTLHDIGLAAWFGGSLFGVAGLNAAAEEAQDERTTARITSVGWAKWTPVTPWRSVPTSSGAPASWPGTAAGPSLRRGPAARR